MNEKLFAEKAEADASREEMAQILENVFGACGQQANGSSLDVLQGRIKKRSRHRRRLRLLGYVGGLLAAVLAAVILAGVLREETERYRESTETAAELRMALPVVTDAYAEGGQLYLVLRTEGVSVDGASVYAEKAGEEGKLAASWDGERQLLSLSYENQNADYRIFFSELEGRSFAITIRVRNGSVTYGEVEDATQP